MPPSKLKAAATKAYSALFLTQKGDVEIGTIQGESAGLTLEAIQNHFKKRQSLEPIGSYPYKTYTLFLFGITNGKEGQENQHQLPPPYDLTTLFMDIVLIASKDEESFANPVPFQMDEYESFYTKSFGGYTSDNSEEDELPEVDIDVDADDIPADEGKDFNADDEEAGESEEEEEEEIDLETDEAIPVSKKVKPVKKKKAAPKPTSTSILTGTSTAYPDKPILSEAEQLQEEPVPCSNDSKQRLQLIMSLKKIFNTMLPPQDIIQLESSIYNGAIQQARRRNIVRSWTYPLFVHIYSMHAKHICANFNPNSYVGNKELFDRYKNNELAISDLAKMDIYELLPSRWKEQFDNRQVREKRQLEGNRSMATDIFLCTKCWKRECTYYEMQTRSADEPMTIFITCLNCGKHWRQ